ncbi:hypothetical protein TrVE_jg5504 [Triparma verrucosa]|uniref:WW domain-containing protein n=1 Tax=Triparma verrucosa TaxID=1606542 RepID=A0A9W7KXA8_9STRA|nr:hypothetical protein TrVE_jg5504 [Triparma verrucosa]
MYISELWKIRKLLDPGQARLEGRYGIDDGMAKAIEERERLEEENLHIKSLSFLYDAYEPKYYWFEVVETLRKLMLSGGLVIWGSGSLSQVVVSMLICLAAMRIFAGCEPYIKYSVDVFNEMSQWQIFFAMFAALLIRVDELRSKSSGLKKKTSFDVVLLLTQALAPAVLVLMVCLKGRSIKKFLKSSVSLFGGRGGKGDESDDVEGGGGGGGGGDVEMNQLNQHKHHHHKRRRHKQDKRVTVIGHDKYHTDEFNLDDERRTSHAVRIDSEGMLAVAKPPPPKARKEKAGGKVVKGQVVKENSGGLLQLKPKAAKVEGGERESFGRDDLNRYNVYASPAAALKKGRGKKPGKGKKVPPPPDSKPSAPERVKNPMFSEGGLPGTKTEYSSESDDDVKPPARAPPARKPPTSKQVTSEPAAPPPPRPLRAPSMVEDDIKPPTSPPPRPLRAPSYDESDSDDVPPPPTPLPSKGWTKLWDEKQQGYYYVHEDGVTSTWDKPKGYVDKYEYVE